MNFKEMYQENEKLFKQLEKVEEKELEQITKENLQAIREYLIQFFPRIKDLNCKVSYREWTKTKEITGLGLITGLGFGIIIVEYEVYISDQVHGYGTAEYRMADHKERWKPITQLEGEIVIGINGLFQRWEMIKRKLETELDLITSYKLKAINNKLKADSKRIETIKKFKI